MNALPDPAYWEGTSDNLQVNSLNTEEEDAPVEFDVQ